MLQSFSQVRPDEAVAGSDETGRTHPTLSVIAYQPNESVAQFFADEHGLAVRDSGNCRYLLVLIKCDPAFSLSLCGLVAACFLLLFHLDKNFNWSLFIEQVADACLVEFDVVRRKSFTCLERKSSTSVSL